MRLLSFGSVLVLLAATFPFAATSLSPRDRLPSPVARTNMPLSGRHAFEAHHPATRAATSDTTLAANFAAAVSYNSGGYVANAVAVADVNGDASPDVLVINECAASLDSTCSGDGTVSAFLNNGDGTLQTPVAYDSAAYQATSVVVGDLNGDGKPDLIATHDCVDSDNCDTGVVGVLLNNGDGTFQTAVPYGAGGYQPGSVAIADVNGDGKLDLLAASSCGSSSTCADGGVLSVLLGYGDGTFQPAVGYGSGAYQAVSVAVMDLNGDGKPDSVVANRCSDADCTTNTGSVSVLLGNGDGTFQAAATYGSGGYQANSVAVVDVNGDAKPDLLIANNCVDSSHCESGTVGVLLGNGDGSFRSALIYGSGGYRASALAVGDLNGDSLPDLLVTNQCASGPPCTGAGTVGVLLNSGDGTLQTAAVYSSGGNGSDSVAIGDLNADGKPDVVIANRCFDADCPDGGVSVLLNITPRGSSTTLASTLDPSTFGQAVTLIATVTTSATGTVTFTEGSVTLGTASITNGTATLPTSTLATSTHSITAAYSGDSNFLPSTSSPLSQVINRATTAVSLSPSQNPAFLTVPVSFTATVTGQFGGVAGGSVTFYSGTSVLGTVTLVSGQAALAHAFTTVGPFSISATYSGDGNNAASTSALLSETTTRVPTTATITSGLNPSTYGQAVTFTGTVYFAPGTPPGNETVNFKEIAKNGAEILLGTSSLSGSTAIFSISTLSIGSHNIKVQYVGDKFFMNCHSAVVAQVVSKAATSTSVNSSLNPAIYGQAVTFTAAVTTSGLTAPTGKVTFKRGAATLGTSVLSAGTATLTASTLNSGNVSVTAMYAGDSSNSTSTSSGLGQVVNKAPTATILMSSQNPSTKGQAVTFTATLSSMTGPVPTGTVTFKTGTTTLCSATLAGGVATCTVSTLLHGNHTVIANYPATSNFLGSSGSVLQTVN